MKNPFDDERVRLVAFGANAALGFLNLIWLWSLAIALIVMFAGFYLLWKSLQDIFRRL